VTTLRPRAAAGVGLRWGRAVVLSLTAWATASAAHVLGGGRLPSPAVVVALIALTAWPLSLLLHRRASTARVVGLLSGGQVVMHTALVLLAGWAAASAAGSGSGSGSASGSGSGLGLGTSMPGMASMPTMAASGAAALPGASGGAGTGGAHSAMLSGADPMMSAHAMPLLPSPLMLLAHAAAAVLLGCGLAVGERALFSLLSALSWVARPLLPAPARIAGLLAALTARVHRSGLSALTAAAVHTERTVLRLPEHLLARAVVRRGPPVAPVNRYGQALPA
jgi:hypothetical protein